MVDSFTCVGGGRRAGVRLSSLNTLQRYADGGKGASKKPRLRSHMRSHIQERSDRTCPIKNVGGDRSARPVQSWSNSNCFPTSTHNDEQLTVRKAFERLLNSYWTVHWTVVGHLLDGALDRASGLLAPTFRLYTKKMHEKLCRSQTIV